MKTTVNVPTQAASRAAKIGANDPVVQAYMIVVGAVDGLSPAKRAMVLKSALEHTASEQTELFAGTNGNPTSK